MKLIVNPQTGDAKLALPLTPTPDGHQLVDVPWKDSPPPPWKWENGILTTKIVSPPVPRQITAWQAKAALAMTPDGDSDLSMLDAANAAIEAMPDGPEKILVKSAWDFNANFHRNSSTIIAFSMAIGLDSESLDALFVQAAALAV
jgi:hypothetical protein